MTLSINPGLIFLRSISAYIPNAHLYGRGLSDDGRPNVILIFNLFICDTERLLNCFIQVGHVGLSSTPSIRFVGLLPIVTIPELFVFINGGEDCCCEQPAGDDDLSLFVSPPL
ncbi:hypothetical protein DERP_003940 [Dermatophagoides pteronyssinus]|uniref:Uncharacterized protein n=1 Tax=Dermatophagoides pteronyssinus TaxID=6956 RepID=A0ABQ8J8A9_DERPT|nr:hypothetical protein DERP_003940 [Dermatophagoides pteronyssinus]